MAAAAVLAGMATRRGAGGSWKPEGAGPAGLDSLASGEPSLADGGWMAAAGAWLSEDGKNKSRWSLASLGVVGVSVADWWGRRQEEKMLAALASSNMVIKPENAAKDQDDPVGY